MMRKPKLEDTLSDRQLQIELKRTKMKNKRWVSIRRIISSMVVLAAIFVLVTVFWFPVYHVTGKSMEPSLKQGQIVLGCRVQNLQPGDIVALYYENQILIRRIIGMPGDWVNIDDYGKVSVNGVALDESYLENIALGATDREYPYLVPEGRFFVMGDDRENALDSRMSFLGCIDRGKIAGKIFFGIWPLSQVVYVG